LPNNTEKEREKEKENRKKRLKLETSTTRHLLFPEVDLLCFRSETTFLRTQSSQIAVVDGKQRKFSLDYKKAIAEKQFICSI
jgi:hypothetical protein